ncbi:hypothetical protein CPU12_12570 [Malaciobacter molluscorum LMG 25693]|uniref:Uncharacterized protein n=1 Tax=Malaciobacter molluscorum LMG 25693 TaxID=870501 RepID=A0A2G1DET2_9BACT|nr:hypothetical protein [Malaciobacter molluscorum]AXX92800.1 hypothetical protein AMOL_1836 [Malaciobacter molluscorum LMG 25693]PHO17008.1 hypothetical protein CPU12_12570 [Malaciobacter molluscorum LMG 25693]RXJ96127.1 hypothetical protein CRV00_02795 [Malaciobacter molluscorum]
MKKIKFIALLFVVFLGFSFVHSSSNELEVDKNALKNKILKINLPKVLPNNLAIKTPSDEWFILQDVSQAIQLFPQEKFKSLKVLELNMKELKGITWRDSKEVKDFIFKESGNYIIYFADELETEMDNTFNLQETIYYNNN